MRTIAKALAATLVACTLCVPFTRAAVPDDVVALREQWEHAKYQTPAPAQEKAFEALAAEAERKLAAAPQSPELLIWTGIIEASYAGAKGGLGALGLVKKARADFEKAIAIAPDSLSGSAYTSLGSLYYQVPGWPVGFGSDEKAAEYLQKGLALNPEGIDSNYFYGDFLFHSGDRAGAEKALRKALQAPPRPGREVADAGRRKEAEALLAKIAAKGD